MSRPIWIPPVPYPAIERHGVIGDRRTAALVAADGTIDWLCLPDYDGDIVFGALLDAEKGGFWRLGPAEARHGRQDYRENTAVLTTTWKNTNSELELTDLLAWPSNERPPEQEQQRVLIRRLRCTAGEISCVLDIFPCDNFADIQLFASPPNAITFRIGSHEISLWASIPVEGFASGGQAVFTLRNGEEVWCVLTLHDELSGWSAQRAADALAETGRYWEQWVDNVSYTGPRANRVRRSAILIHLQSYAPAGSLVASPTTSLPERIGGDWTADYRYAWIRDTSLSLAVLTLLGCMEDPHRYMDWLTTLDSSTDEPLQVLYGIRGATELPQREREDLHGYRGSRPIRFQNHAYQQRQLDSLGYLNDCCHVYLANGCEWKPEYWDLIRRVADYTADHWRLPDNSIWELPVEQHYVSGKVMSWVGLDRAVKIADKLGHAAGVERWRSVRGEIHAEVMEKGWSERLGAFRQRFEGENLDASALLIPVMDFLPADHPRVLATVERIVEHLAIDGFVYRFDPRETPGVGSVFGHSGTPGAGASLLGEFEGAFLPCTFWLATTYAKAGQPDKAEAILNRAEEVAGSLGLFAEGVDVRSGTFLGNYPLLFSQIEYIRAVLETAKARPLGAARMMLGKAKQQLANLFKE